MARALQSSRVSVPSFTIIAGLALGISGLAYRSRRASRFAIVIGIGLASVSYPLAYQGRACRSRSGLRSLFNFQNERQSSLKAFPASIRLMQAGLASYRACSVPQSCLPLLILIIIAICPDCLPLAGLRLLHLPPNGLLPCPFGLALLA